MRMHSLKGSMNRNKCVLSLALLLLRNIFVGASETTPVIESSSVSPKKFAVNGPVLTVTLRDPFIETKQPVSQRRTLETTEDEESMPRRWFGGRGSSSFGGFSGLSSLSPTLLWSVKSTSPPLPNYIPSLQSTSLTAAYKYDDLKSAPSFFEGALKFHSKRTGIDVDIGPSYEVKPNKASVVVRVGGERGEGGGCFGVARFTNKGKQILEHVRASYRLSLPFSAVSAVSITPSFDFARSSSSCTLTGKSGTGRTAAVLDLNWSDPTLSVVHALDERNTISPEISLYNAKIMYNWNIALDSGSIQARVDPTSAIQVSWTDRSMNGKWVTDFNLPLAGTPGPIAADIRVRRQFIF